MYKLLLFLGTILSLLSCMDSREKEVMTLLNEWVGKEILYPKNLLICNDSSGNSLESKYKVFIYTDSLGCVSCKLNLAKWRTFISMVDSVAPGNVRALFVFQPKRINELRMLLKNENFSYSLYIDKNYQHKGIGSSLIAYAFEILKLQYKYVLISTLVQNSANDFIKRLVENY